MRVGLMADCHDRVPAIAELLRRMMESGVGMVLHAGDYCSPFALAPFSDASVSVAGVFGKNDGDPQGLIARATAGFGAELFESPHSFDVAGRRVLIVHDIGDVQARSVEGHEVVVHGCTHLQDQRSHGSSLIINPGEACGWLYGTPSAAILDLETLQVEMLTLDGSDWRC